MNFFKIKIGPIFGGKFMKMRKAIELLEGIKENPGERFEKNKDQKETFKNIIEDLEKGIKVFFEKEKKPLARGILAGTFYILWQKRSLSEISLGEIAEIFGIKNETAVLRGALSASEIIKKYFSSS